MVPKPAGFAEKVTCSPVSGFPLKVTRAVTVEVMVEFAAIVPGFAEIIRVPEVMVTVVDLDMSSHVAVMLAVPVVNSG